MIKQILKWFLPAKPIQKLSDEEINKKYPVYRWHVLESTFIGYAAFYFVRNNLSVVSKEMGQAL